jgi:hypothetical protein
LAMVAGILNASEAVREIRPILQCFELGLGIVSYSNEKTKRAKILKIKVLLITQF